MEAKTRRAADYQEMRDDVQKFRVVLEDLLTCTVPSGHHLLPETAKEGQQDAVNALTRQLSTLAGRAALGFAALPLLIGTEMNGREVKLNPAQTWLMIMQPKPLLRRDDVLNACLQAEGLLSARARTAQRQEREAAEEARRRRFSPTRLLARAIGWPHRVRAEAGLSDGSTTGKWLERGLTTVLALLVAAVTSVPVGGAFALVRSWLGE